MQVIIAEKPSVAREIAAIVGAVVRRDGYIEGNGYAVTWAFGHLVAPAMPEAYGIEGFRRENLPILPETFILEPRKVKSGKEYKPDAGAVKQLGILKGLFSRAERIVVATDAGREGELIFRYIYQYLDCHTPFDRLWISSLTDKAIREGLQNIRPGSEYDNLYLSARARSEADWIVGINASQALAITVGRGTWSLGRVQTPTLALVCERYLENKSFSPQTYYRLKLHTAKDATAFAAISSERYASKEEAQRAYATVMEAGNVQVTKVERREVREQPPLLYDLTALQKDANKRFGFSAEKTLDIAQSLYEAKLITYPRTGSRYIPDDVFDEIYPLLTPLWDNPRFGYQAVAVSNSELNRRPVDASKVTDHHALLVTGNDPGKLTEDQVKVYEMIAGRMVEAFSKECVRIVTSIRLTCADISFEVRGTITQSAGWRKVWGEKEERSEDEATALPTLNEGDKLSVRGCDLQEKQTRPRSLHTESSLLAAMETAGKELEDEAEREAMKDSGLGTPATRAAVIETLFSREYLKREKKSLVPTDKGLAVYGIVKEMRIADAAMTGGWELALSKIATAEMNAFTFRKGIEVYTSQIVSELLKAQVGAVASRSGAKCPRCGSTVFFYPKIAKCQNKECGLTVFRTVAKKELSDAQLTNLLTKGRTGTIQGFRKADGTTFDAAVTFDEEYKAVFDFGQRKQERPDKAKIRK